MLHILCDLSIAAETAKFGQTGPKVGSFDAGYGAGYLANIVGQKKAREIWYLCRQYTAAEALEMGLVNKVVPFDELEAECVSWAREMLQFSPTALRFMKASFNAATDGLAGIQQLAGDATLLYYNHRRGERRPRRVQREARARFHPVPEVPVGFEPAAPVAARPKANGGDSGERRPTNDTRGVGSNSDDRRV